MYSLLLAQVADRQAERTLRGFFKGVRRPLGSEKGAQVKGKADADDHL